MGASVPDQDQGARVALKLDIAAEYLVMAAWLAYLKSRLLLPRDEESDEPDAETMAEALQFQLRRLEAMQKAAEDLFSLPQLGQDIFPRGMAEGVRTVTETSWDASLYDILKAYGDIRHRKESKNYDLPVFHLMSMEDALKRVRRMLEAIRARGHNSSGPPITALCLKI